MKVETAHVASHDRVTAAYYVLTLDAPGVAPCVRAGQFIHVRIPALETSVLRRPFSVYQAGQGRVSILYKTVGGGTRALSTAPPGTAVSVIGPLGNGFPELREGCVPVLVAGGYGVAPLSLLASRCARKGVVFVGGATQTDLLCLDEFRKLGWDLRLATEDGSCGMRGLVTDALDAWCRERSHGGAPEIFACGPDGMLRAVGERAIRAGWTAWLSLDRHMGCGIGACLACVQKIRDAAGQIEWKRVCRDGPVFEAREIVWP